MGTKPVDRAALDRALVVDIASPPADAIPTARRSAWIERHPSAALLVRFVLPALMFVVGTACVAESLGWAQLKVLRSESGVIEIATVVGYGALVASLMVWIGVHRAGGCAVSPPQFPLTLAAVLAAMAGRELDLHKRLTSGNVMKTSYYLDANISTVEKLAALSVLVLVGVAVSRLLWAYGPGFRGRLAAGCRASQLVASGVIVVMISKVVDRSVTKLDRAVGGLSTRFEGIVGVSEELMELLIPLFFAAAGIAHLWSQARRLALLVRQPSMTDQATATPTRRAA